MAAEPRIAMLVQNTFERDPRVYRAAQSARRAGFRVIALGVRPQSREGLRWGELVDGVPVYESGAGRRTLLRRLRTLTAGYLARRQRKAALADSGQSGGAQHYAPPARTGLVQSARDVAVMALLIRNNIDVYLRFRGIGARAVHANDLTVLLSGYLLARHWRAVLIYDSHELWTEMDGGASPLRRRLVRILEGWLIRRAQGVITVNGALAAELAGLYGIPLPTVVMNCPAVPSSDLGQGTEDELPCPPAVGPGQIAAIYQGGINYQAPHVEAMLDDVATVQEVAFTLRGTGVMPRRLRQRLADLEAPNIRVVPPVPMQEVVSALRGYDVGLVPYQAVNKHFRLVSPNKLFEYMMAGLAVICSDPPLLREIVTREDCGLLYDPTRPGELASALRRLAGDPQLLARYKENARRAALERYNADVEEAKLIALYRKLLGYADADCS